MRVLIAGGACAIGLALADELRQRGHEPLLSYHSPAGLTRIQEHFSADKPPSLPLDLAKPAGIEALLQACEPIEALIDLAHSDFEALIATADQEAVARYFSANIAGRYALLRAACRMMLARRYGRLVFVSSQAAVKPAAGQGFYAASKQAAEQLYLCAGQELAERGVTSAVLRPGYIRAGRGTRYLAKHDPQPPALSLAAVVAEIISLLDSSVNEIRELRA